MSNLDTEVLTKEEAERITNSIRAAAVLIDQFVVDALGSGAPPGIVLASLLAAQRDQPGPAEARKTMQTLMAPVLDRLTQMTLQQAAEWAPGAPSSGTVEVRRQAADAAGGVR